MLRSRGQLGTDKRRMWVADSFAGLPPASYSEGFEQALGKGLGLNAGDLNGMLGKYRNSKLTGTRQVVESNFHTHLLPFPIGAPAVAAPLAAQGVRLVQGFFNESLPGPIRTEGRKLALLRVDSDIFSSIYETLERLYPLLSVGGYVVFDDWKIPQARAAAVVYRIKYGIRSKIFGSDLNHAPPFWTIDRMAFWRKEADESNVTIASSDVSIDEQAASWAAQRLGMRGGLKNLQSGVCFRPLSGASDVTPSTGATQKAAESAKTAADCYRACELEPQCVYLTFVQSTGRRRCVLKSAGAMPMRDLA